MSSAGTWAGGREGPVSMEFRVLGPVETWCGGSMVPVPPGRQTAVLAALLLRANRVVSVTELAEALWAS